MNVVWIAGGCGHRMHPDCWKTYVTHCAHSARGDASRAGLGLDARGRLHVLCPKCRRAVAGEFELAAFSGGRVGSEQYERLNSRL